MRILIAHNRYKILGGEETVVNAEAELLRSHGHEVRLLVRDNHDLDSMNALGAAATAVWSRRTSAEIQALHRQFKPELLHVHNSFPLISPSVYWSAAALGIPVVKTLHNFRLVCVQGSLLRGDQVCHKCIDGLPVWGAVHRCYRDSAAQSMISTTVHLSHRILGTYARKIDRFIVMSRFARRLFSEVGLPIDRLQVKPNFVPYLPDAHAPRSDFLYVGRLSAEKGMKTLSAAMALAGDARLSVAGMGPLADAIDGAPNTTMLGRLEPIEVSSRMQRALALVLPSTSYEGCPMVILEAYANGLPVIASRLGSIPEFVDDGGTGLLFNPGDPADLAAKLRWAAEHPAEMLAMGERARAVHREHYSPERNYRMLMDVYEQAIAQRARRADPAHDPHAVS